MFLATHGVLRRSSAFVPPVFADTYSFEYDGVSDYLEIADSDSLSFGNGSSDSPFSISTWVNMTDASVFRILSKYTSSAKEYLLATDSTDKIVFSLYDDSTGGRLSRKYNTALTSLQGQWIHLTATYDGTTNLSGLKIYLNGFQVDDSNNQSGTYDSMENTSQIVEIGKLTTTNANGMIDETSIFDYELTSANVSTIYGSGVPTDISSLNPVGHWRAENATFDGSNWNITDSGSGNNNATSVSMTSASRTSDVPVFNSRSLEFDGVSDYVSLASRTQNFVDFSLSFWCIVSSSNYKAILGSSNTSNGGILYAIVQAGGTIRYRDTSTSWTSLTSGISDGNWHHVCITYDDNSNTLKGYTDGSLTTTINPDYSSKATQSHSFDKIGSYGTGAFFPNKIDEISVFNSVLSASDVSTIYGSGVPTDISNLYPVHWWRADGDTAPTLTDNGSGGIDGTMNGFSTFSTDVPT